MFSQEAREQTLAEKWGLNVNKKEPAPRTNDTTPVHEVLINMIRCRALEGKKKYGTHLQAGNGRDALMDALQESLDMNQYLMQVIMEGKRTFPKTIFTDNSVIDQLAHLNSEAIEFVVAYQVWLQNTTQGNFNYMIDEANDFTHSLQTLSDIDNDICKISIARVITKNKKRGYYVDNDNVKV